MQNREFPAPAPARVNAEPCAHGFVSIFVLHSWEPTGCEAFKKRRECLYEAVDFIRVLAYSSIANQGQKRLKYSHFEVDASPGFSSSKKAPNSSSVSLTGPDCVADCTGKASRWKLLNATT